VTVRVLLVDDAMDIRRLVRTALRLRGGFEVVGEAETGAAAAVLAGQLRPDVIVLDLGLPDITGKDVLTRVRREAPTSKVVVFSGAEADDPDWFEKRAAGYVLKDGEIDLLVDLLAEVAAQPRDEGLVDLPAELTAVREARRIVAGVLEQWDLHTLAEDAAVVVTELTTNAVEHASSPSRLRLSRTRNGVRIEVQDAGQGTPEPQAPSETAEGGRGLLIVSALSTAWGIDDAPDGKTVWAELTLPTG